MGPPLHVHKSSQTDSGNASEHKQFTKSHEQNASNIVPMVKVESPIKPLEHDDDAGKGEEA